MTRRTALKWADRLQPKNRAQFVTILTTPSTPADGPDWAEFVLEQINESLHAYGVEALSCEGADNGRFWYDAVALYVNRGDTYDLTVVYDIGRDTFLLTSWGDWVETQERTGRYRFQ